MEKRIKIILYLIAILLALIVSKVFFQDSYLDFRVYFEAAINTLQYGDPYSTTDPNMSYLYPPLTIILFLPLTVFSVTSAEKIWLVLSILLFILSLWILFKFLRISWRSYEGLAYSICCLVFFPFKFTLGMGQINMVILFFLILFLYFYEKQKTLSGLFLTVAIFIKISPLLFLGELFLRKQWNILFGVVVTALCLSIMSLFMFPLPTAYYISSILPSISQAWPTAYYNQSLTGFLGRLPVMAYMLIIARSLIVLGVLVITSVIVKKYEKERNQLLVLSSIFPVLLIISSFSWQHHFILLIPSYIILSHVVVCRNVFNRQTIVILISILISYLLVGYNIKQPELMPVLVQSHVFYGTVMLWIVHLYVIQKEL
jgi:alpha-1,2-mannosyltransferase